MARGETRPLEELYGRYRPYLLNLAAYLLFGDRYAAEDVVQNAFLTAWRTAQKFSPDGPLKVRNWLVKITRFECYHWWARAANRPVLSLDYDNDALGRPFAESIADARAADAFGLIEDDRIGHLYAAIEQLKPGDQTVLDLKFWRNLEHDAIASHMGSTVNAVQQSLRRSKRQLRAAMIGGHLDEAGKPGLSSRLQSHQTYKVALNPEQRQRLTDLVASKAGTDRHITHAKILLMSDAGHWDTVIMAHLKVGASMILRARKKFIEGGVDGAIHDRSHARRYAHQATA